MGDGKNIFEQIMVMEKILLAIDAMNPKPAGLDFATYLARLTRSKLTGVFLENLMKEEKVVLHEMQGVSYVVRELDKTSPDYLHKMEIIDKNIALFQNACESRGVGCMVHRDKGAPLQEILKESRYSDVMVIDPDISFTEKFEDIPSSFVKHVLRDTECPVIISPENFESVNELIFTYNEEEPSVKAIKQFTYLFPEYRDKQVTVVEVTEEGKLQNGGLPRFKEWLNSHYTHVEFRALRGEAEAQLFDYLFARKNAFIVMGAYGRDMISQYLRHSSAEFLIRTMPHPVFIYHG